MERIKAFAKAYHADVVQMELASQFRCNGSDGYLAWLDNTLQILETANTDPRGVGYDFRICDSPNELRDLIFERNQEKNRARIVAGYFWPWVKGKRHARRDRKERLTTRAQLRKYQEEDALDVLDGIRQEILNIDVDDVGNALATVCQIKGLGIAGASGLLSLIYPENYATVDQFVVKTLLEVPEHRHAAEQMNPESLTLADGVTLTEILRSKAAAMNDQFVSTFWNPRTLEMALWAYRGA